MSKYLMSISGLLIVGLVLLPSCTSETEEPAEEVEVELRLPQAESAPEAPAAVDATAEPPMQEVSTDEVKQEVREAVDAVGDLAKQKRDEFAASMRDTIADIDTKLEALRAESAEAGEEAQAKLKEQMEKLGEQRDALQSKLDEFQEASGDAWENLKQGFENAATDLNNAIKSAADSYKKPEAEDEPNP